MDYSPSMHGAGPRSHSLLPKLLGAFSHCYLFTMVADCDSDLESPIDRASPNPNRDEESPLLPRDTPQVVPIAGIATVITVLLLGMWYVLTASQRSR